MFNTQILSHKIPQLEAEKKNPYRKILNITNIFKYY